MVRQGRLSMTKPDILMQTLAVCNHNYSRITEEKKPTIEQPKLKNVTPRKKKFMQLEFNLESDGVNE